MCRIIILFLGGMLAMLVAAGATTIAYKITKPSVAQESGAARAGLVDPILTRHLRDVREEMALP
jgi:hypothetical protein